VEHCAIANKSSSVCLARGSSSPDSAVDSRVFLAQDYSDVATLQYHRIGAHLMVPFDHVANKSASRAVIIPAWKLGVEFFPPPLSWRISYST